MKKAALLAIKAYQRYLSPYKGFHCAFHAHTGRNTCSGYGYRVIARHGLVRGARLLHRRLQACSTIYQLHYRPRQTARQEPGRLLAPQLRHQRGEVCAIFEACTVLEACDVASGVCEVAQCFSNHSTSQDRPNHVRDVILWSVLIIGICLTVAWYFSTH